MRARPLLLPALALPMLACSFDWGPSIVYFQAMDYHIDRTRILAIATTPPLVTPGETVVLDALVLSPTGQVTTGAWKACGLGAIDPPMIWDLQCFSDDLDVSVVGEGIPATWAVPDPWSCDDTSCTAYATFPVLLEVGEGDDLQRGTFTVDGWAGMGPDTGGVGTGDGNLRDATLTLTLPDPVDGTVTVDAWLGVDATSGTFAWYVDDGTLLDTGRTAAQGTRDDGVWTRNRWVLPEAPGSYRIVVAVSAASLNATELAGSTTNMTWAVASVEVQ